MNHLLLAKRLYLFGFLKLSLLLVFACQMSESPRLESSKILVTSEAGARQAAQPNITFKNGKASGVVLEILPDQKKQVMDGIGSSFTESSAFVLAHLPEAKRQEVMEKIYSDKGANFSLARIHIGSCDFSVEGKYSYAEVPGDKDLKHFSIAPDKAGFAKTQYPGIVDEQYDLLPMVKEALAIKKAQSAQTLNIIASAWTAPPWMKDIEAYFIPGSPANNYQGTGGQLKKEYEATFASYITRYLDAYKKEGIPIWGLTPVNEPHGNNGQWESMHFTPKSQNEFIKSHLGPTLKKAGFADTRLLIFDQNRNHMRKWANTILSDKETSPFVYGTAVHWYESTFKVFEEEFEKVRQQFPGFAIIHTEGCIDDLGKTAPDGIGDPERFKESGWFNNDAFWWNPNATDWAYTAPWDGVVQEDHPIYTPVHRYARNIIVSIDHWLQGWVDWNIVLDKNGGPNHVGNYCGAPIMIDTEKQYVYYTPIFDVLAQFSRTIRPGDVAVQTRQSFTSLKDDDLHACATLSNTNMLSVQLLNTTRKPIDFQLQIGGQYADVSIPANAVQTIQVQL
jgi:glucosylceramidase